MVIFIHSAKSFGLSMRLALRFGWVARDNVDLRGDDLED
jgi:hypothetical protein